MSDKEKCIDICNKLLRGEISAVETYDQVLEKYGTEPQARELRVIRNDHQESVKALRDNIVRMGGKPSDDSGAWGTFAKSVAGSAKLVGEGAAVGALKQGEEHGKEEYSDALKDENVMLECKEMIRSSLLPKVKNHIQTLDALS